MILCHWHRVIKHYNGACDIARRMSCLSRRCHCVLCSTKLIYFNHGLMRSHYKLQLWFIFKHSNHLGTTGTANCKCTRGGSKGSRVRPRLASNDPKWSSWCRHMARTAEALYGATGKLTVRTSTCIGRLFHASEATTGNAQSPKDARSVNNETNLERRCTHSRRLIQF